MTTMLEYLAIDASSVLTNQDRQELLAAYETPEDREGSIVVALMVIAIVVNVVRLVMDHCVDKESFTRRARKPHFFDKQNLRRRVKQTLRAMEFPEDMEGLTADQIGEEILSRSVEIEQETLGTIWDENHDV